MRPNVDRMKLLREHFAKQPEESVDMNLWWCGTAGCLAGHACNVPEFREAGLHLGKALGGIYLTPVIGELDHQDAIAALLCIEHHEAEELCDPSSHSNRAWDDDYEEWVVQTCTKAEALSRLDTLIAKYETTPTA